MKFKEITKGFWAPDSAKEYAEKLSKIAATEAVSQSAEPRAPSAIESAKGSNIGDKNEDMEPELPPFTPLIPEFWKTKCMEFGNLHVIKFPRILQSLFYILKRNERELICDNDTNKLSWKKARKFFQSSGEDSIYHQMNEYWPIGPKEGEFKEYQKLKFI